jgi:hypothetical protein
MQRGTVLLHEAFEFENGDIGKKFLIVVNNPAQNDPYLMCLTTSQRGNRPDREGCHPQTGVYVLRVGYDFFELQTWVQLYRIYEADAKALLKARFDGNLTIKANLQDQTIRAIVNCIKKSPDISKYRKGLISKG